MVEPMVLKQLRHFRRIAVFLVASGTLAQAADISLDPQTTFQTMSGWEATADLPDNPTAPVWTPYRQEMLDRIVNEVGINRLRVEIRSGAENSTGVIHRFINGKLDLKTWEGTRYQSNNDNADPFEINWGGFDFAELDWHIQNTAIPIRQRLAARGEPLIINLCYVNFSGPGLHADAEEYAEFVLATYLHMQEKYGFVPDMWEVVLEPDLNNRGWSGEMIGQAMAATATRLRAHGFKPSFVAPSVTDIKNIMPYLEGIASVPGAMDAFDEVSYHRYWGAWPEILSQVTEFAKQHKQRVSMLEWWFGNATHEILHEDLTVGNNSAWQGRVERGLFTTKNKPTQRLELQPEVRYNLQYFRHVRHGAVRIGAVSTQPDMFNPVAFINTDGRYTVIVKASRGGSLRISGLPEDSRYQVSYAIASGSVASPDFVTLGADGWLTASIPDAGVLTIAAE